VRDEPLVAPNKKVVKKPLRGTLAYFGRIVFNFFLPTVRLYEAKNGRKICSLRI